MDKRTLLAVVLSVIVISVGFFIQSTFFMPPVEEVAETRSDETSEEEQADGKEDTSSREEESLDEGGTDSEQAQQEEQSEPTSVAAPEASSRIELHGEDPREQEVVVENSVLRATFTNRGGVATSIRLKNHEDQGEPLEMVQNEDTGLGAFGMTFGEPHDGYTEVPFHVRRIDDLTLEFYRDFAVPSTTGDPIPFTVRKKFEFEPEGYLVEVRIEIVNSVNAYLPLDFNGYAYTLGYGPEIGPEIDELDGRYEYRKYYTYAEGDRDNHKISGQETLNTRVSWAALLGKYFTVISIPDSTQYDITFSEKPVEGLEHSHQLFFSRPKINSSRNEDVFQFYVGPKLNRELTSYNDPDKNGFKTRDLHLEEVMDTGWAILGWLEWVLKKLLVFFHSIVPNWGVAIIMLTIAIKVVLFPITHKSYESTSKMQNLNPKIQEIRAKYKDNPQKMNQEMASLYKTEGVNPMGGCLPLLLQMPIFIALFGLLNKHFDLRGATFIEGWISDLSGPESIFNFAPIEIPILGWSDIRLLPIIFAGTMFLSSKMMQSPGASSQGNMKMIMYFMPLFLFFILYNAPSGLLLYWIMTNFLTVVQQKVIGKYRKTHPAGAAAGGGTVATGGSGTGSGGEKTGGKAQITDKTAGKNSAGAKGTETKGGGKTSKTAGKSAAGAKKKTGTSKSSSNSKSSSSSKAKKPSKASEAKRRYSVPKQNRTKKKKK
ncbi:MAG: membrane protein insertase YidC [Spirochaetaceae bacterium]